MPRLRDVRRTWREACAEALFGRGCREAPHQSCNGLVGKRLQVAGVPKRAPARLAMIAVRQKSPKARVSPLAVRIRLREPAHRMG